MAKSAAQLKQQIIDANLNRLSEGLRIIEEIVRFGIRNKVLLSQIRQKKHTLWQCLSDIRLKAIYARDSRKDLGRVADFDNLKRDNLFDVFTANIKRAQESSRVLEELFKIDNVSVARFFKQMRFWLYELESALLRLLTPVFDPSLYVIINTEITPRRALALITKQIINGGATMIQLREPKDTLTKQWLLDARIIKRNIKNSNIKFIINDRLDVALAVDADGVHLGQFDMPLTKARQILGFGKIIGITTRNLSQAQLAEKQGADYISVGSIYPSPTKPSAPIVGIKTLKTIARKIKIPVIAIGGIQPAHIKELAKLGISGIAISVRSVIK